MRDLLKSLLHSVGIVTPHQFLEQDPGWAVPLMAVSLVLLALMALAAAGAWRLRRRRRRAWLAAAGAGIALFAVALPVCAATGGYLWFYRRPQPAPVEAQPLFEGITYSREVQENPPRITHIVEVDLATPGLRFLVTPPDPRGDYQTRARTTSEFVEEFGVHVAINGGPFGPTRAKSPWDYYPRSGDGVDMNYLAISGGEIYSPGRGPRHYLETFSVSREERVSIAHDLTAWHAVTGWSLDADGAVEGEEAPPDSEARTPRTGLALDGDGKRLILAVIDGYQPGYSLGATQRELAEALRRRGGVEMVNLDGGDSSTLVIADARGRARALNAPIYVGIPGREAPVGNHLGIRVETSAGDRTASLTAAGSGPATASAPHGSSGPTPPAE